MKRWDHKTNKNIENVKVDNFLRALIQVSKEHNMSLGHEDGHGGFLVSEGFSQRNADWLMDASIDS